jgi:glucosamine 6-phosphate synthetase-like amidotransferase/phosphosugar isomerase protein
LRPALTTRAGPEIGRCIYQSLHQEEVQYLARELGQAHDFLFLARGIHYPIAMEGALKLKEISYIHAEGYPAGEMKHSPNALIDQLWRI